MGSGALGLAYAAAGQLDIYFHHRLFPWDVASGLLLVSEAGGVVTNRQGQPGTLDRSQRDCHQPAPPGPVPRGH